MPQDTDSLSFAQAFGKLTGHVPMRWQCRLFEGMREGRLPEGVDLPTGLGKTSVMAIWLLARALAEPGVTLPRRLVYVVDRRVVVDQATGEADKIAAALRPGQDDSLVQELRDRLGLGPDQGLAVSTLRGGKADDREWSYDPAAPAIIVCTVDMAGSRLLFSGYRLSRWSRSVQAGLIGVDSLIVLDEAHIAPAFLKAVQRVRALRTETSDQAIPPLRFLPLSATPPKDEAKDVFRLEPADYDDSLVKSRTGQNRPTKRIAFAAVASAKGALVSALADSTAAFDNTARAVLVFCDSRADANTTADALRKQLAKQRGTQESELKEDVALITGARRGRERDELVKKPTYRAFTYKDGKRDLPEDGRTRYLICTAAGEVGADLDADAAVMDLVPLERMIQRLGRVNRRGGCAEAAAVTIHYDPAALNVPALEKNEKKKAEAERLDSTKTVLEILPPLDDGFDASPFRLATLPADARQAASTPPPEIPTIEREHVEAWALTSLKEHPGRPEVDCFLHGIVDDEPQTTVVWRADVAFLAQLPARMVEQALAAARLMPAEMLEAPTREVVQVLQERVKALRKDWKRAQNAGERAPAPARLLVLRYGKLIAIGEIMPERAVLTRVQSRNKDADLTLDGDARDIQRMIEHATLLFEPAFGGLDQDGALDAGAKGHNGLHVQPEEGRSHWGVLIRLVPPPSEGGEDKARLLTAPPALLGEEDGLRGREIAPAARRRLGLRWAWFAELPPESGEPDEDGSTLEYWKHWDMDGETGAASRSQLLDDHHREAKAEMERLSKRLALSDELADALVCGVSIHDSGKDRDIWKSGMGVPRDGRAYAKSGGRGPGVRGYRHEFGSLRDALYKKGGTAAVLAALNDDLRDLALHGIASHHGRVRPSILAEDEEEIFPAVLDQDAFGAAMRYVRLQRRWGPWGLAWLEALFRSVDATISRRLEVEGETGTTATKEAAE